MVSIRLIVREVSNTPSVLTGSTTLEAMKVKKSVKVKSTTANVVLKISGSKGSVYRLASVTEANGEKSYKLVQNNVGLQYDGARFTLKEVAEKKVNKQTKLEMGAYVAGKGSSVTITEMTLEQARKEAVNEAIISRNGKDVKVLYAGKAELHYIPTLEKMTGGKEHWFQWETAKIKNRNEKHYGALVKSK